jgi:cytochrome c oxidase assembly protein subunit 15
MSVSHYNRPLHYLALLTACCTFPLIFLGGLVTSHQAGMSVPDWPNSYGYNMWLFPISMWRGGIFYEHTHRLMGTLVGFCSVLLMLKAWGFGQKLSTRRVLRASSILAVTTALMILLVISAIAPGRELRGALVQTVVAMIGLSLVLACASIMHVPEERRWVCWLATSVLGMVLLQGVLGGLRVVLVKLDLAIVHACVAQAFFCLAALASIVTSRWWIETERNFQLAAGHRLIVAAVAATVIIYAQLIAGAVMRHYQAGLAIPDVPLTYGKLLPPATADDMVAVNDHRVYDLELPSVTLGQIWIHFAHRVGAVVVTAMVAVVVWMALKLRRREFTLLGILLSVLIVSQVTLGIYTVLKQKPADIASLHVAVGALTLLTTFSIAVRAMRVYSPTLLGRPEFKRVHADDRLGPAPAPVPA